MVTIEILVTIEISGAGRTCVALVQGEGENNIALKKEAKR
jgi:hypothetical protein